VRRRDFITLLAARPLGRGRLPRRYNRTSHLNQSRPTAPIELDIGRWNSVGVPSEDSNLYIRTGLWIGNRRTGHGEEDWARGTRRSNHVDRFHEPEPEAFNDLRAHEIGEEKHTFAVGQGRRGTAYVDIRLRGTILARKGEDILPFDYAVPNLGETCREREHANCMTDTLLKFLLDIRCIWRLLRFLDHDALLSFFNHRQRSTVRRRQDSLCGARRIIEDSMIDVACVNPFAFFPLDAVCDLKHYGDT
jgi:hypothetical protein